MKPKHHPYILLLRGINVGGKHRLPMAALRDIVTQGGGHEVHTYIQSGNAVFHCEHPLSPEAESTFANHIAQRIQEDHGFTPEIYLLSATRWQGILEQSPFDLQEGKAVHVYFLSAAPPAPDLEKLKTLALVDEHFALKTDAFYLSAPAGIGRSRLAAAVEKALGVPCTARNGKTVLAIQALLHK